jgi:predicted pyridoxine 5'-phosphate oxidase superfamily flavin-nucleotide-binding protein
MPKIPDNLARFFEAQGFLIVSTIDAHGRPHSACKDIIKINRSGTIYLLDLYLRETFKNLKRNPKISLTAVDEHKFQGYCLKGKARMLGAGALSPALKKIWEGRIASRVTQRILRNLKGEKGHARHPESLFPLPQYLIAVEVEEIVDLTTGIFRGGE